MSAATDPGDEKGWTFESEVKKLSSYADQKLDKIFRRMLGDLFKDMPEDPIQVRWHT